MCDVSADKAAVNQVKELRLKSDDFDVLRTIGRGAFGEVCHS